MSERGDIPSRPSEGIDVDAIDSNRQPIFCRNDKEKDLDSAEKNLQFGVLADSLNNFWLEKTFLYLSRE